MDFLRLLSLNSSVKRFWPENILPLLFLSVRCVPEVAVGEMKLNVSFAGIA